VLYMDVAKVDRNVAHVASISDECCKRFNLDVAYALHICCKSMFQMFHLFHFLCCSKCFHVASILFGCCICCGGYTRMLQVYVPNIIAILDVCCKCFI
jgi:hypothetical protein